MGEDESNKHARFRWTIDAVRYAIAGVVTALTVAVIAWAIVQSMRPEVLRLSIASGYVTVGEIKSMSPPVSVSISFELDATNPGGRASILYSNVTVHFLYNRSLLGPEITYIEVQEGKLWVAPLIRRQVYLSSGSLKAPADVDMEFAKKMFKKQEIKNAMVVVEGTMKTQTSALDYTSGRSTKYSCFPVAIGTSPNGADDEDVTCDLWAS